MSELMFELDPTGIGKKCGFASFKGGSAYNSQRNSETHDVFHNNGNNVCKEDSCAGNWTRGRLAKVSVLDSLFSLRRTKQTALFPRPLISSLLHASLVSSSPHIIHIDRSHMISLNMAINNSIQDVIRCWSFDAFRYSHPTCS